MSTRPTAPIGNPAPYPSLNRAGEELLMERGSLPQAQSSISSMGGNSAPVVVSPEAIAAAMLILQANASNNQQVINFPDGSSYTGPTQNGQPHGRGVLRFSSSNENKRERYEGEFVNGQRDGQGVMTWTTGEMYKGNWASNQMKGRGHMREVNGSVYEGEFDNSMRNGQGVTTAADGNVTKGSYQNDELNGQGEITQTNGSVQRGRFENGHFVQGRLTTIQGTYKEGTWRNGELWEGTYRSASNGVIFKYKEGKIVKTCTLL